MPWAGVKLLLKVFCLIVMESVQIKQSVISKTPWLPLIKIVGLSKLLQLIIKLWIQNTCTLEVCTVSSVNGCSYGIISYMDIGLVLFGLFNRIACLVVAIEVGVLFLEDVVSFSVLSGSGAGGKLNASCKYFGISPVPPSSVWCVSNKKKLLICSLMPGGMLEKGRLCPRCEKEF